jgi:hypothetical protein
MRAILLKNFYLLLAGNTDRERESLSVCFYLFARVERCLREGKQTKLKDARSGVSLNLIDEERTMALHYALVGSGRI